MADLKVDYLDKDNVGVEDILNASAPAVLQASANRLSKMAKIIVLSNFFYSCLIFDLPLETDPLVVLAGGR